MGALTHNGEIMQGLPANASQINFDKTGTDLNATQAEAAIKEVNGKVNTNAEDITQLKSGIIKRTRITDTTSSAGTIATAIDFNRAVSAMCITGYNYYLNIRESSVGKAVVFAYELADGYQSLKPLLNTEITFDLLYI